MWLMATILFSHISRRIKHQPKFISDKIYHPNTIQKDSPKKRSTLKSNLIQTLCQRKISLLTQKQ